MRFETILLCFHKYINPQIPQNLLMGLYDFVYSSASIYLSARWVYKKYSDAQKEATARYNKKAYDRIDVIVKKGQ